MPSYFCIKYRRKILKGEFDDNNKYVAFNAMWHDMRGSLDDSQILVAAYNFYFADEDCDDTSPKIWRYMACMDKPQTA